MSYVVAPCTIKAAIKKVKECHRHLPDLQGGLFAAQVIGPSGECAGVAVFGNPWMEWQGTGRGVITRCAAHEDLPKVIASDGEEHAAPACTMLYSALCRAARALGYREAWTYTLPHEPGRSLKAAGFIDMGLTDGGEHDRKSRRRKPAANSAPKRRWLRQLRGVALPQAQRGDAT
jgi:hypothetical protein